MTPARLRRYFAPNWRFFAMVDSGLRGNSVLHNAHCRTRRPWRFLENSKCRYEKRMPT